MGGGSSFESSFLQIFFIYKTFRNYKLEARQSKAGSTVRISYLHSLKDLNGKSFSKEEAATPGHE